MPSNSRSNIVIFIRNDLHSVLRTLHPSYPCFTNAHIQTVAFLETSRCWYLGLPAPIATQPALYALQKQLKTANHNPNHLPHPLNLASQRGTTKGQR